MLTYTPQTVEKLLRNYLDIRLSLDVQGMDYRASAPTRVTELPVRERPFGQTRSGPSWPFMGKQHAPKVRDGKRQAQQREELHCAALDIEAAMQRISEDDYWLLYNHLVIGSYTLDDLVKKFHFQGRNGARMRVARAVARLAREMER